MPKLSFLVCGVVFALVLTVVVVLSFVDGVDNKNVVFLREANAEETSIAQFSAGNDKGSSGGGASLAKEFDSLKQWMAQRFVFRDELNDAIDKRIAVHDKSNQAHKHSGRQQTRRQSSGGGHTHARLTTQASQGNMQAKAPQASAPDPLQCMGGRWVAIGVGSYNCVIETVQPPPQVVSDTARIVANACGSAGIVPDGQGGWKCRPEARATQPDTAVYSALAPAPTTEASPASAHSAKQSLLWATVGCVASLATGGGSSGCVRGAVLSGGGDAIGQSIGGTNGGHVGGAIGTAASVAVARRVAGAAGVAPVATAVNPPLL